LASCPPSLFLPPDGSGPHGARPPVPTRPSSAPLKAALVTPAAELPAASVQPSEVTVFADPSPLVVFDCTLSGPLTGKFPTHAARSEESTSELQSRLDLSWLHLLAGFASLLVRGS